MIMNRKLGIVLGMTVLTSILSGCSNTPAQPEKTAAKPKMVEEKEKEKTPYEVLESAVKKNEQWTSWSTHTTSHIKQADIYGGTDKVFEIDNDEYANYQNLDDGYYGAASWDVGDWGQFRIVYVKDKMYQLTGYSANAPAPMNGHIGFRAFELSKKALEANRQPISMNEAFKETDLFEATQTKEGDKTTIAFQLKDSKKFQDFLLSEDEDAQSKRTLDNGLEVNENDFTQYDFTYVVDKDGFVESYSYVMTEKYTEDKEGTYSSEVIFYNPDQVNWDVETIDAFFDQIPKDQDEGEFTTDLTFTATKPEGK